jgi:hypothetical protein
VKVSLNCQQKGDVGGTYGFHNSSSKSRNILNNLEGQEVQPEHVTPATKCVDFHCVAQVEETRVAIKEGDGGLTIKPNLVGPLSNELIPTCQISKGSASSLEGVTSNKELRSRLISKPLLEHESDSI